MNEFAEGKLIRLAKNEVRYLKTNLVHISSETKFIFTIRLRKYCKVSNTNHDYYFIKENVYMILYEGGY